MILLDTHVLIWCSLQPQRLGSGASNLLLQAWREGRVTVSAVSFLETTLLVQAKRLTLARTLDAWREEWLRQGLRELPLDGALAIASSLLNGLPAQGPGAWFDRALVATALAHGATLLSADAQLLRWIGPLQRFDARA
jgi:PIN domain nuclease of toxin-antitoxin system